MTGRGDFSRSVKSGIRILLAAQALWLAAVCALGAWWGVLVLRQARMIARLEQAAGLAASQAQAQWLRTQHMLVGESASYFALVLALTGVLFWLYWRDARRARGLQAFFASLTHELRTPLTSIRLQAESIADGLAGDSAHRELVQRLLEDTQRLELQVERILELARVEGGGPIFTQAIEIKPWLERATEQMTEQARQGGKAQIELDVQPVRILADQVAMQVILKNLMENSIRHSRQERVRIRISTRIEPEGVFLVFSDNGKGFDGDSRFLGKLFEKGAGSSGAGVGLYLVQVLMKRMGGFARFATGSGSGPGFEVSLFFSRGTAHE